MKRLLRVWGMSLLLIFCFISPVQAQQAPTNPPVPTLSPGAQTIIQTTTNAIDRYGLLNVAMFILLIAVVLIAVVAARSFVVPLINANSAGNQQQVLLVQQLAAISQQGFRAQQDTAVAIQRLADSADRSRDFDERMANLMNTLESKRDSHEERVTMAKQISEHAEEVVRPVKEVADNTLETVMEIENKLDTLMKRDEFTDLIAVQLQPVRNDIAELRKTIEQQLLPTIRVVVVPTEEVPPTNEPPKDDLPSSSTIPGVPLS